MRLIAILVAVSAAYAASPEQAYFAARDKAIGEVQILSAKGNQAEAETVQNAVLADLQTRLLAIVGLSSIKGFSSEPKINLETLGNAPNYGMLDGLAYAPTGKGQEGSRLVVTTKSLLAAWLRGHVAELDANLRDPAYLDGALRSDNFYTFGLGEGAAFSRGVEIEIDKPADADFAAAALARRSGVIHPSPLDRMVAAVVKNGRVFVADIAPAMKIPEFPACLTLWRLANAKADAVSDAFQKSGEVDELYPIKGIRKIHEKGARDWLSCAGRAAKAGPLYPRLKREAQDLVDRMAGD